MTLDKLLKPKQHLVSGVNIANMHHYDQINFSGSLDYFKLRLDNWLHLSVFQIHFITQDDKRKMFWITRRRLDKELVPPAVQWSEGGWSSDVTDKNAAVSSSVESHS